MSVLKLISFCLLLLTLFSCSQKKELILVLDVSGSMQKDDRIHEVKHSLKSLLLENYQRFQSIKLIIFSEHSQIIFNKKIENNQQLNELYKQIDDIKAKGNWTNLVGVMDNSLELVKDARETDPDTQITIIVFTDGKHDVPQKGENISFNDLLKKYYGDYNPQQKDWFIYYIELAEKNPEFTDFLEKTGSGTVISGKDYKNRNNFQFTKEDWKEIFMGAGVGFLLLLIGQILLNLQKPWVGDHFLLLKDSGRTVNLSQFGKPLLFRRISLGKSAQATVAGPGIKDKHAYLLINSYGEFFIRPVGDAPVHINGSRIYKKSKVIVGQNFKIGDVNLELQIKK